MPNARRTKPGNADDDGSGGNWTSGLPSSVVGATNPPIDYDPQGGAPREHTGGTYRPNVTGAPQPAHSPSPSPFKLTR